MKTEMSPAPVNREERSDVAIPMIVRISQVIAA
jgi:hypothetical protein